MALFKKGGDNCQVGDDFKRAHPTHAETMREMKRHEDQAFQNELDESMNTIDLNMK